MCASGKDVLDSRPRQNANAVHRATTDAAGGVKGERPHQARSGANPHREA